MKFLLALLIVALVAAEVSAYKVQDQLRDKKYEQSGKKSLLGHREPYEKFDLGKEPLKRHERPMQKPLKKFDVDFKELAEKQKPAERMATELKLDQFRAPSSKLHVQMQVPNKFYKSSDKKHFGKKFDLGYKPDEFQMKLAQPKHHRYSAKLHKPAEPVFHKDKFEHAEQRLEDLEYQLHPEQFHSSLDRLEEKADYLQNSGKLMETGFSRLEGKHLDKPFFGVYGEMDELEDTLDYLKDRERKLSQMEMHPSKDRLAGAAEELAKGDGMLTKGFRHFEKVEPEPQVKQLKSEFDRLGYGREKLDAAEDYLEDVDLEEGYEQLAGREEHLNDGVELMDHQFDALHDNDLHHKFEALEDNYDDLDSQHTGLHQLAEQGKHFTFVDNFGAGFNFMNDHMDKIGGGSNMFWKGNDAMSFPGFGKSSAQGWDKFSY
ncbi:unnamed protein product [Dibothriocephalus latus]|uniref:Uncharacterized protein n=1 Tax=Dibothriocephalus latus TaxID=60516 RepID=A0A3P7NVM8_DIBLA|nr:unnamed protein product [Dibothriocephalus latus]